MTIAQSRFVPEPAPQIPVAALVLGKPVDDVAELLPRLFNLCRTAQSMAVRIALGLTPDASAEDLAAEIRRDHLLRFFVIWPDHLGLPTGLPEGCRSASPVEPKTLFGPAGALPTDARDFDAFLETQVGVAVTLRAIADCFGSGEAVAENLPAPDWFTLFDPNAAVENSLGGRYACHPVMRSIAGRFGRGPLWRAMGRAYDLEATLTGALPPVASPAPGMATVPAARGTYAVLAEASGGLVTAFKRITPTDHLLAPGGIMERTLSSLPAEHAMLAPLVVDILDPCTPVGLKAVHHA